MSQAGYKQFCPVAMAAEVLCTRWTMVLMRELVAGTTRFNDLRRGVPKMSPALLSTRLKELEQAGVIERRALPSERGIYEYHLTEAGKDRLRFSGSPRMCERCLLAWKDSFRRAIKSNASSRSALRSIRRLHRNLG